MEDLKRQLRFGSFRSLQPLVHSFKFEGQCIDRYYIDGFLSRHAEDIRGHVLEIGDDSYTRRFGGSRSAKSRC